MNADGSWQHSGASASPLPNLADEIGVQYA